MVYALGGILLIICVMAAFLFFKIVKLKDIKESLDISIIKIEDILNNKLELVHKLLDNVEDKKIKLKFKYDEKDSLINREDSLFDVCFNINKYFKDTNNKNDKVLDNLSELNLLEEELDGLKDFYNANILDYDEIFLKRYLHIIFVKLKFSDYKPFKIRKLEEYEIFKN